MSNLITKAALSRLAGVSRMAVTKAAKGALADAVVDKKINLNHSLVIEWLKSHGVKDEDIHLPEPKEKTTTTKPVAKKKSKKKKAAAKSKPGTVPDKPTPAPPMPAAKPNPAPITVGGYDIDGLEDMTLREIVMRYGSIDGFKRYVDSLKSISDFNMRDMKMKTHRGELVQRDLVAGTLIPLIDVAYQRLVSDVPAAITQQIIARVESGGEDMIGDSEKIIRDAVSRVLKNTKSSIMKMEILKDAS